VPQQAAAAAAVAAAAEAMLLPSSRAAGTAQATAPGVTGLHSGAPPAGGRPERRAKSGDYFSSTFFPPKIDKSAAYLPKDGRTPE
jgi:hypothetical protein